MHYLRDDPKFVALAGEYREKFPKYFSSPAVMAKRAISRKYILNRSEYDIVSEFYNFIDHPDREKLTEQQLARIGALLAEFEETSKV